MMVTRVYINVSLKKNNNNNKILCIAKRFENFSVFSGSKTCLHFLQRLSKKVDNGSGNLMYLYVSIFFLIF